MIYKRRPPENEQTGVAKATAGGKISALSYIGARTKKYGSLIVSRGEAICG
jgi:hypothetical protein